MNQQNASLWGGRFQEATDQFVQHFTASVDFDKRLYSYDIQGSQAHARTLAKAGVFTEKEAEQVIAALEQIRNEIAEGKFNWQIALEDVHMNIEKRLTDLIGTLGKKLHTGRSRNDQVATDIRLFLRAEIDAILEQIKQLYTVLTKLAQDHLETIMPGFTHLQVAQPITFGYHILAWRAMLTRDCQRIKDLRKRVNVCPLGSAALAGTSYNLDRKYTAQLLGFTAVSTNSLDAVSDRDFIIEFMSAAATLMMHFSRWSEELILWNSIQFDFVHLPDRFCTGSSIMPQKKNPDVPELIRGKSARVFGHLTAMLTLMKSQPLAYNKDNQEDKEPLFDTVDTLKHCLHALISMLAHIKVKADKMRKAAHAGYATATDLADYLVNKGIAFRDAHEIVGKVVAFAIIERKDIAELSLEQLRQFSATIEQDVYNWVSLEGSIARRKTLGGTSPEQVRQEINQPLH